MTENHDPPARRGRGWQVAALVVVLVGAFGAQASSTWLLAERYHVEPYARPFLILMLEVGAITGAALYLSTRDKVTRRSAGLLVIVASGVGGFGGVTRYGVLLGGATGLVLLLIVHTIGRHWSTTREENTVPEWDDRKPSWEDLAPTTHELIPEPEPEVTYDDVTCKSCGRGMAVHEGQPLRCPSPHPMMVPADGVDGFRSTSASVVVTPEPRPEPLPAPGPEPEVERPRAHDEPAHTDPRPPELGDREEATRDAPTGPRLVPPRRTRRELEDAGRALPEDLRVTRRAGESKESLSARVEDAEQEARRRARTSA